jgi:transposase InsO family protein
LLTERTRRALWRARHGAARHVAADEPGELVCLDTFYIGNLKGVGKVWQITACDAASSYGIATILPALTSEAAAAFLCTALVPAFRKAGWPIQRVLTDGGPEFKKAFDEACTAAGIRHTRTKTRHAWTNGFVERLQQTILHEHWRILPPALLQRPGGAAPHASAVHADLQLRAAPSGLSHPRPYPGDGRLRRASHGSLNS